MGRLSARAVHVRGRRRTAQPCQSPLLRGILERIVQVQVIVWRDHDNAYAREFVGNSEDWSIACEEEVAVPDASAGVILEPPADRLPAHAASNHERLAKVSGRSYRLDLFSVETWQESRDAGFEASGFTERRWKIVQRMKPGDYLLCYLTGISRFVGLLEVAGDPYRSDERIWQGALFSARIP